jgi:hypothetical protein
MKRHKASFRQQKGRSIISQLEEGTLSASGMPGIEPTIAGNEELALQLRAAGKRSGGARWLVVWLCVEQP